MSVEAKGKIVAELKSGQFVGEMSYVTSDAASANVTANGPVRCFAWSQSALQTLLRKNPSLRMEFQSVLTNDLAKKLRR
jgi:CRP-like cAMP-binding protein